jgi:hypothetical protein
MISECGSERADARPSQRLACRNDVSLVWVAAEPVEHRRHA